MRPRLKTASVRLSTSGSTPRASGVARSRSGTMRTKDRSSLSGSAACTGLPSTVVAATRPPNALAAAFSGCPSYAAATAKGSVGARGSGRRGSQGGRRAEAAGHGDLRAHRHGEAVVPEHLGGDARRQVRRVVEETRPLPLGAHPQRRRRLDLDAHVAVQRHRQRVEPGPEVGRRGGGPGAHGAQATRVRRSAGAVTGAGRPAAAAPGRPRAACPASPPRCRPARPAGPGR